MTPRSATVSIVAIAAAACGNKGGDEPPPGNHPPPITSAWSDDFERAALGDDYYATGGDYKITKGALGTRGAFNHPLWLRKKLPREVSIEFDTWSNTADGDIKVEVFGDGRSHASNKGAYTSTGYAVIMGGWSNQRSILARKDEHGTAMAQRTRPKVAIGVHYHWKIVRKGSRLDWYVDDMSRSFLSYEDDSPLEGSGHDYFAFSNWQSDSWFDNLRVTPL